MSPGSGCITEPTGSGKSSTLAALLDLINSREPRHIVTIEDPIEFVHNDRLSTFTQREIGRDTDSFEAALRSAGRQDPARKPEVLLPLRPTSPPCTVQDKRRQ